VTRHQVRRSASRSIEGKYPDCEGPRYARRTLAILRFTLSTGEQVRKTVEDDQVQAEVEAFRTHQREYGADFFPVDDGLWVLRTAVISIGPDAEPFVA
jgi:hypothetical protein